MTIIISSSLQETNYKNNIYLADKNNNCKQRFHEKIKTIRDPLVSNNKCLSAGGVNSEKNYTVCNLQNKSLNTKNCINKDYTTCLSPVINAYWIDKNKKVCVYDLDMITSASLVEEYIEKFGILDMGAHQILQKVCTSVEYINCPKHPETNKTMNYCMVLRALTKTGDLCRLWEAQTDRKLINALKQEWCSYHVSSEDCKCINKALDKSYIDLTDEINVFEESYCWYKPCLGDGFLNLEKNKKCETNVCQTIYSIKDNNLVKMDDITSNINCNAFQINNSFESNKNLLFVFLLGVLFMMVFSIFNNQVV